MPTIVPAPKKITPAVAAQLMQRRSEGASARALEREFDISNQAIGKFFRKEDAKRAAELERANQQTREGRNARGDRTRPDPARAPEHRQPGPADGGPPLEERQPPRRLFYSDDVPKFASAEERLAYYEARRLDDPPYSIWDSNAVRRGELTAAERNHRRR